MNMDMNSNNYNTGIYFEINFQYLVNNNWDTSLSIVKKANLFIYFIPTFIHGVISRTLFSTKIFGKVTLLTFLYIYKVHTICA